MKLHIIKIYEFNPRNLIISKLLTCFLLHLCKDQEPTNLVSLNNNDDEQSFPPNVSVSVINESNNHVADAKVSKS